MKKLAVGVLLAVAIGGAYYNTLDNEFVFDDYFIVLDNSAVRLPPQEWPKLFGLDGGVGAYRPLRTLSYVVDYRLGGDRPFVYHLFNLIYHWLASCLVFLVAGQLIANNAVARRQLPVARPLDSAPRTPHCALQIALGAALLWVLHPVQTDSVAYISGRRDILAGLFFFLGFSAFLRLRTPDSKLRTRDRAVWVGTAFLAFVLGALCKEAAFVLPVVFFAYDVCQQHAPGQSLWRSFWLTFWRYKWLYLPFFFLAVGALWSYPSYLSVILHWHGSRPLSTWATVPRIWVHYLKLLLFPMTLNADYSNAFPLSSSFLEGRALAATLVVVMLIATVLWGLSRGYRLTAFCGLWFIITLLPVSHFLPHPELLADHYLYVPSFGFCLLVGLALTRLADSRGDPVGRPAGGRGVSRPSMKAAAGYGLMALLLTFYGVRTVVRNADWQDELTLWRKTIATAPSSARAHYNLGVVLKEREDLRGALQAFQSAAAANPSYGYSYTGMAEVYLQWMQLREALTYAQQGRDLRPQWPWAHFILGQVYFRSGEPLPAISAFEQAVVLRPDLLPAYMTLAELYRTLGDEEKAKEWQRRLLEHGGGVPSFLFPGGEEKRAEEEEKEEGK
jgi:tetratricopeptide (TPR) repeat protein